LEFKCRLTMATLGRLGAIAWDGKRFFLSYGFKVRALDTTGAGDIFHGAFIYGVLQGWPLEVILEFSNAAAALNCTASGARGRIASLTEIDNLRRTGSRSKQAYTSKQLLEAVEVALRNFPSDGCATNKKAK
jgi:sulfofructose kinase